MSTLDRPNTEIQQAAKNQGLRIFGIERQKTKSLNINSSFEKIDTLEKSERHFEIVRKDRKKREKKESMGKYGRGLQRNGKSFMKHLNSYLSNIDYIGNLISNKKDVSSNIFITA